MRRLRLAGPLLAFATLSLPAHSTAGAWTQEPGHAYLRWSGGVLSTDTRFDSAGEKVPFDEAGGGTRNTGYEDVSVSLYGELGLHRDWTLVGDLTWKRVQAEQPSAIFTTYGLADLRLGVKRSLWRGPSTRVSASALATVPGGYDTGEYPALGSDVGELAVILELGTSNAFGWVNLEGGVRLRGGEFRNQASGALGGGFHLASGIALRGEVRGFEPVGSEGAAPDARRFDPSAVDPSQVDLAGTLSVPVLPGWASEIEVRSTVAGENTLTGTRISVALATRRAARVW